MKQVIQLNLNGIEDGGAVAIAEAIKSCPNLIMLFLAYNKIRDTGAIAIARSLAQGSCPKLQRLQLHGNQIGDDGATALGQALKFCPDFKATLCGLSVFSCAVNLSANACWLSRPQCSRESAGAAISVD